MESVAADFVEALVWMWTGLLMLARLIFGAIPPFA